MQHKSKSKNQKGPHPRPPSLRFRLRRRCGRASPPLSKGRRNIFVGLSGGVDSSVAAALLKKQGYNVVGVFIKIWQEKWGPCNWKEDKRDAMRVAQYLEIPFKTIDLSDEYQKQVASYMIREYQAGRTPNPDVICNTKIKFGTFLRWAKREGADFVATGHYARLRREIPNSKFQMSNQGQISNIKYQMLRGVDKSKDQSYFLWQLKQSQLKHCLFPIGEYEKSEVRKMAKKFGLPTAEKRDSQGICFVGQIGMKEFLKKYIQEKHGEVLNTKGEVIGHHDGAFFLTIGQRRGFTITKKGTNDKPYYVVSKDVKKNTVTVANASKQTTVNRQQKVIINNINWISDIPIKNKKYQARFRHLQKLLNCSIVKISKNEYEIKFSKPQTGVASGQSLVLYGKQVCLGGGVIK